MSLDLKRLAAAVQLLGLTSQTNKEVLIIGERGPVGPVGPQGEQGVDGPVGSMGPRGFQGARGDKGDRGEKGDKGDRGDKGEPGEKGEQGEPGERGERGLQGKKGDKGDKGEPGKSGPAGPASQPIVIASTKPTWGHIQGTLADQTDLATALNASVGAQTWTGDKTLAENVGIVLDPALSADGKYSGIVETGTAGAALAFGELCYLQTSDSRWELAKANAASTSANQLGICVLAAAGDGSATVMLLFGKVRADALFDTFTIGAPVYSSAATAGKIVSAAPTGTTDFVVRKVGFAEDANTVFFNPSNDYITLA